MNENRNANIITDADGKKQVLINDIRFKVKAGDDWKAVEKYPINIMPFHAAYSPRLCNMPFKNKTKFLLFIHLIYFLFYLISKTICIMSIDILLDMDLFPTFLIITHWE